MAYMNKSVFISYRFSNVPIEIVNQLINPIYYLLKTNNIDVFCNLYDADKYIEQKYTVKQIMNECFDVLRNKDVVLCLVDTNQHSCGMLLEIGYALAHGKEIIICSRMGCQIQTLDHMGTKTLTYHDYDELLNHIKTIFSL